MDNAKDNFDELAEKIVAGVQRAVRKMVEASAVKGESVVIGDADGSIKYIPAKELLKSYPDQN